VSEAEAAEEKESIWADKKKIAGKARCACIYGENKQKESRPKSKIRGEIELKTPIADAEEKEIVDELKISWSKE